MTSAGATTGQRLGPYRILAKVGAGGMGEVYRAHDERLQRDVALKFLPANAFQDADARARLLREARTASQLCHPNICTIFEVGEHAGQAYIAMELVEGRPLNDRLRAGPLPAAEVLRLGRQLAEALGHAHDHGIIHRDFKSANVVVNEKGLAKVLDFGLAKRLSTPTDDGETHSLSLTQPGAVIGTVSYMAPEQLRGLPADARSDVWSLGVVLYELLAGALPFRGSTGFELSSAILMQAHRPLPSTVPAELRAVVERCLEKEPQRRYQRAAEVCAALEAIEAGTAPAVPLRNRLPRWWPAVPLGLALVVAALAIFDVAGPRSRVQEFTGGAPVRSLAVLPLENLSGDPEQEYLADGLTDELITHLGSLREVRVIARSSVMRFKGSRLPLRQIASELNVQSLITGTVLRSGDKVRLTAEIVDPQTEQQLWSRRYERELRDVLGLQRELTQAVAGELRATLSPRGQDQSAPRPVNPEAYEALLKSRFHFNKLTAEDFKLGGQYIELALEKDPDFAPAYAALATQHGGPAHMGFVPPREVAEEVKAAARRAVELDPTLPRAHATLATWTFYLDWDWAAAEKHFERAGQLGVDGNVTRADLDLLFGRHREAEAALRRALQLDPLNSWTHVAVGGRMLRLGLYEEALQLLEKVAKVEPNMGLARRYLWTAYHNQRRYDAAREQAILFLRFTNYEEGAVALERAAALSYPQAMRLAADALVERSRQRYVQPSEIARLYFYAGDQERAFEWLDRAYEARDTWLTFLNNDPRFTGLHSDPRFTALLRRLNIPTS